MEVKPHYLIAFPTGGRPLTSHVMQQALKLALIDRSDVEVTCIRWREDTETLFPTIDVPNITPGAAFNLALANFVVKWGDIPEVFITMNDDTVIGMQTIDRLGAIAFADPQIGVLGAWNDLSERGRGQLMTLNHGMGSDIIQYGEDFCVGGALHLIPKRAISRFYKDEMLYPETLRREDEYFCNKVRTSMKAVLATTVPIALLPDDKLNPWYRDAIITMHYTFTRKGFPSD